MATKQEKAVQRAVSKEKKRGKEREEKHVLGVLLAIIALLLYLLLAQQMGWWPYSRPKLGSAFYTNVSAQTTAPDAGSTAGDDDGSGGSGGSGGGGNGGGSTSSGILNFAAKVNVGDTKEEVSGNANGLGEGCAVVASADATTGGHQEVCTYTEGDKIVTVTYLNDRVVSASKSGF